MDSVAGDGKMARSPKLGDVGRSRTTPPTAWQASSIYGPGARALVEATYGPAPGSKPLIRGKGQYWARDEILIATSQLIRRQARDLRAVTGPKPRCNYDHSLFPTCDDADCQRWLDSVAEWHAKRVGGPHAYLATSFAYALARDPNLGPATEETRLPELNPVVIGEGPTIDGPWTTFELHIHEDASSSDVHALVNRLWKEAHTRAGRIARPARAVYWRHLSAKGRSHQGIADEWLELTDRWTVDPDGRPTSADVEYDAYKEWRGAVVERGRRKRPRTAPDGDGEFVGPDAVGWTFARLAEFEEAADPLRAGI